MTSLSIVTTVLNDKNNIKHCINSVRNQNLENKIEHIIVDAGSRDGTIEILKKLKKNNKTLKIYLRNKINIYEGINYGIKKSKNKYIGLLHSDDFYKNSNSLKLVLREFKKNVKIPALYSNVSIVDRKNINKEIRFFKSRKLNYKDFLRGLHPPHTSLFLEKKIFKKYGLYNVKFKIASDFEYMLRLFGVKKVKTMFINKTLIVMRSGGTSTKSILNIIKSNFEVYQAYKDNLLDYKLSVFINKIFKKIFQLKFWVISFNSNCINKVIFSLQ